MHHLFAGLAVGSTLAFCILVANSRAEDVKPSSAPVTVTAANADSMVEVALGQTLRVMLAARLGTGFSWRAAPNSTDTLTLVTSNVESNLSEPGGLETQVLVFRATKPGAGSLTLQ